MAVGGIVASMAGLYMMYAARSGFNLLLSGVLLGLGVSGTGIPSLVGAVGRAAPPEKRTSAIASLAMAAGIGSFIAFLPRAGSVAPAPKCDTFDSRG
jgi:hypothetical protein